jgi:UPF0271 protein
MAKIDINCDMGESFGNYTLGDDAKMLDYVTSANIACGFHAGDPVVMARTVQMAAAKGVAVGAHPSYPDLQGFGRRKMDMTPDEIEALVLYQVGALAGFVKAYGAELTHVKAHGMLYNTAAVEFPVARAITRGISRFSKELTLVCLATAYDWIEEGAKQGLRVAREAFADRGYNPDGTLVSRKQPGSVFSDPRQSVEQVLSLVKRGEIVTADGSVLKLQADTVCVHGDGPAALPIAKALREELTREGVELCPPGR